MVAMGGNRVASSSTRLFPRHDREFPNRIPWRERKKEDDRRSWLVPSPTLASTTSRVSSLSSHFQLLRHARNVAMRVPASDWIDFSLLEDAESELVLFDLFQSPPPTWSIEPIESSPVSPVERSDQSLVLPPPQSPPLADSKKKRIRKRRKQEIAELRDVVGSLRGKRDSLRALSHATTSARQSVSWENRARYEASARRSAEMTNRQLHVALTRHAEITQRLVGLISTSGGASSRRRRLGNQGIKSGRAADEKQRVLEQAVVPPQDAIHEYWMGEELASCLDNGAATMYQRTPTRRPQCET